MDMTAFFDMVEAASDLEGISIDADTVAIGHIPSKTRIEFAPDTVEAHNWEDLYAVITGERNPQVLQHITRVTGYYSQTNNWNESKKGELLDRHKGNYVV